MCHPRVMLMSLVPVPGTFLLLSLSDIPLAIVPCNEVAPHGMPYGGPSPLLLVATPIVVSANSSDWNKANCPLYQRLTKRTR